MISMALFLFPFFSSLLFALILGHNSVLGSAHERGSGFAVGGSGSLWVLREKGAAQHLTWGITPWSRRTPGGARSWVPA